MTRRYIHEPTFGWFAIHQSRCLARETTRLRTNLRWADYQHQHTKLTSFRILLGKLLYYQKIEFAADERQKDGRPGWSSRKKASYTIQRKTMETSLSYKSPQHTKTEGIPRSKLVPQAEHATCMSP